MARVAPEDPFCGLPDPSQLAKEPQDFDLFDGVELEMPQLLERAKVAEAAATAVQGVTNSEGGSAGRAFSMSAYANTAGFNGAGWIGWHSVSVSAIAGKDTGMETDYDYEARTYLSDMPSPESVGKKAGERAVKRLNPRKLDSGAMPIVFDPRVSSGLIGHFLGAINGAGVARGTSFLKDKLGEMVFAPGISIIDDPLRRRGFRSRWFDLEGVAAPTRALIEDGRLTRLAAGLRHGAPAWHAEHRPCIARHILAALTGTDQCASAARQADTDRTDGRHQGRAVCHPSDRHGRQRRDRRLQPRRRRLPDPQW